MVALIQPNIDRALLRVQDPYGARFTSTKTKKLLKKLPMIGQPILDLKQAKWSRDGEGIRRAGGQIFEKVLSLNSLGFWVANTLCIPTVISAKIAADYFFGAWAPVSIACSGMLAYRATTFRSHLLQRFIDPTLNEEKRILNTLELIKEKITPEVQIQPEDHLHGPIYRQWEARRQFDRLAVGTFQHMKRRTDQKTAERIFREIDLHLKNMEDPTPQNVLHAKEFIQEILKINKKAIWTSVLYAFSTLLAFTGLLITTFTPLATLALCFTIAYWTINIGLLLYPKLAVK